MSDFGSIMICCRCQREVSACVCSSSGGSGPGGSGPGLKFDQDKVRVDLVRPSFIVGVGRVLTYGAHKYAAENWTGLHHPRRRQIGAVLRHLLDYSAGIKTDPETGLPHIDHAACDLMFIHAYDLADTPEDPIPCGDASCAFCYPSGKLP